MEFVLPINDMTILLENIEADDIDSLTNTFGTHDVNEIKKCLTYGLYLNHNNTVIGYILIKHDDIFYSPLLIHISLGYKLLHICLYVFKKYRNNNYEHFYTNKIIDHHFNVLKTRYIYIGINKLEDNIFITKLKHNVIKIFNNDNIDNHYIIVNPICQNDKRIIKKIKEIESIINNNLYI